MRAPPIIDCNDIATILNAISNPATAQDSCGTYKYCNSAFLNLIQQPSEKVIGRHSQDFFSDARSKAHELVNQGLLGPKSESITFEIQCHISENCILGRSRVLLFSAISPIDRAVSIISIYSGAKCNHPSIIKSKFKLTPREFCILKLLLSGAPYKSIASSLGISLNTAREYAKSLYLKLDVSSRSQLQDQVHAICHDDSSLEIN